AADGEQFVALAKVAAAGDSAAIVAAGGDGSIGSVASVLAGTDKPLGVLPLGTLNHFSRDLGIPPDLDEAVRTVVRGRVARIDVGEVNGRIFVNNSGIGLYPRIVHHREQQREKLGWGKWPAFVWATLHTLHRHRSLDVVLASDGREIRRETPFVFIGNNFYEMEGFDVGTRERLDRGELSAYLAPGAKPADFLILALRALLGRLRGSPGFEVLRTTELRIETRGDRARVANDGEIAMLPTPLRYRILPGALHVIVPSEPIQKAQ
ncbi:MAG TPA: diacylglycerol kinase family protein, partial [Thermoanaerobaculia bacterium]|nr:diacylglycerol kinase family protein [Thermoanaerobaculia bacterium]